MKISITDNKQLNKNATFVSMGELFYLLYFAVMLGAKAVGLYEGQLVYNICLVLGAGFFTLKLLFTKHSIKEYIIIALFLLLGVVVYLQSGEKALLICFTMMLGMKEVSTDRVFKVGFSIWIVAFVSIYVLAVIGIIPEYASTMLRAGWPVILRHSLGYPHPNSLHAAYFVLVVLALYLGKRLKKGYILAISAVLFLGNCYVFIYSLSRNGFLVTSFLIAINIYFVLRTRRSKLEDFVLMLLMPMGVAFILVLPLVTTGEVFLKFNTVLAGRFEYTRYYLTYEPLKLFGIESIPTPQNTYNYVIDSSYVYLIFRLGLVAFFLVLLMMIYVLYDALKNNRRTEAAILISFYLYGIVELYLFNQSFKNFTFIFMGTCLYHLLGKFHDREYAILGHKERYIRIYRNRQKNPIVPINIWVFNAIILVVVGILTSCLYIAVIPAPENIYLPRSEEKDSGDGIPTFLTEEEVKELRKEGNIIRGYVDEYTPIYKMKSKSVAKVEHIRYIISYGIWGGSIAFFIFLFVWTAKSRVRAFKRNKEIGPDYKENVLIIHNYYRIPGGEDVVVANERRMLEEHGHKVVCYFRNNSEAKDSSFRKKIGLAFTSLFSLKSYREICKLIEKEKIDVVHIHNTVALVSPAAYLAGINMGVPVVQTIHNFRLVCPNGVCYIKGHVCENCIVHGLKASLIYNCYRDSKLQTFVMSLSMRIQRAIRTYASINYICLTEFNKEKLLTIKQIDKDSVFIKPNFTRANSEIIPYSERKHQIVFAGRLEKIKGVDLLLQAWMKMGDRAPKLVLCGSGELESWCKEYIENNELSNVEMIGQVDNETAKHLIGESLAMIHPTQWYEGFPMTIAEAYSVGTPIIASDIGNVGSLVVDKVTGMKFKSNSVVSLANTVEKFVDNPVVVPDEYLTKYSEDNNYKILKSIYESIRKTSL